jgi:hypothetical protein
MTGDTSSGPPRDQFRIVAPFAVEDDPADGPTIVMNDAAGRPVLSRWDVHRASRAEIHDARKIVQAAADRLWEQITAGMPTWVNPDDALMAELAAALPETQPVDPDYLLAQQVLVRIAGKSRVAGAIQALHEVEELLQAGSGEVVLRRVRERLRELGTHD